MDTRSEGSNSYVGLDDTSIDPLLMHFLKNENLMDLAEQLKDLTLSEKEHVLKVIS